MAAAALAAFIPIVIALVLLPFTPSVPGNGGPTSDGIRYASVVSAIRDGAPTWTEAPYIYRILPLGVIAALPLGIREGFVLLNGLATIATGPLLLALLRLAGIPVHLALVAVLWWAVLPTTVRYTLHYPTTLDAIGFALLVSVLALAIAGRTVTFAVVLATAVLARENTILAVLPLWVRGLARAAPRATFRAAMAAFPAAAAILAVRIWPPIPSTMWWTQYDLALMHIAGLLTRADLQLRYVTAIPLSLGLLTVVPLIAPRTSAAELRRQPGWALYVVATLLAAAVGGWDHDRFMLWLVPPLAVLTFSVVRALLADVRVAIALTALHLVAVRFLWPMDAGGRQLLVATMDLERGVAAAAAFGAAAIGAWLLSRRARSAPAPASRTVPA